MGFCFKQLRVALKGEPFFDVNEETQELKLTFLNWFGIRISEDAKLLNICLSDGSLLLCQRYLARCFFAISSRTRIEIGKKFWHLGSFLTVELQAAD